ncbi:MAG: MATE family efflux transporter [Pirellulaceae bacterium]
MLTSATVHSWWSRPCGGRDVLELAFPLVLSSLSWTLLTFVDRMFLMRWSPDALAASFPAALLWWSLICCPLGLCMYTGTFVSQYFGAGESSRMGTVVWQGVWIALLASPIAMLPMLFSDAIFAVAGHTEEVRVQEVVYFRILCLSTPAMLVSSAFSCFYSGQGKTWIVMAVDVASVVLNIGLDYAWIFGYAGFPAAGIAGAAWATLVAITVKVLVYFVLLALPSNRRLFGSLDWKWDGHLLRRLLHFGGPAGLQMLLEVAGFTVFVFLVGSLGVKELAATNLAFNISSLAFMPVFGLSTAVSILVGQQLGRNDPALAARGTWTSMWLAMGYMLGVSTLYLTVPDVFLVGFFVGDPTSSGEEIRGIAIVLLRYVAAYNLFDALNMIFVHAIKGAGDTRFVFLTSLWMGALLAVGTWVAMEYFEAGLHGCWGLITVWVWMLGLIYLLRFLRGPWRSMRVIEAAPTSSIS